MEMPYKTWNDAIGRYFFRPQYAGQRVFLTVDDDTVWKISQGNDFPLRCAHSDHAVQAFVAAVRDELCRHGAWSFETPREGEYPLFLGFLAIQVLAAFKMREEPPWSATAYWGRLGELLGDTTSRRPLGLEENRHQALWRQGLDYWANDLQQGRWGTVSLPPYAPRGKQRRDHVGLPKSQALLTSADLTLLPRFYHAARLQPGEDVDEAFLLEQIQPLLKKSSLFRPHAQRVLGDDDRKLLACGQIREHLRRGHWDEPMGKARLWLATDEHAPQRWDGGLMVGNQVLPEIRLPEILGKATYSYASGKTFRPLHARYYVTVRDAFHGRWEERRHAKPGDEVLLLTPQREVELGYKHIYYYVAAEEDVTLYYADGSNAPPVHDATTLRGLPQGWCALQFHVRAELSAAMPSWCRPWLYAPPLQLLGGLRLARQTWMAGAGPTVLVRAPDGTTVYIDGFPCTVVGRHVTPQHVPSLEQPGRHTVQIEGHSWLQFQVIDTGVLPERMIAGWILQDQGWPSLEWQGTASDSLSSTARRIQGPVISDQGTQETSTAIPLQRRWLTLAVQLRGERTGKQAFSFAQTDHASHPLVQQMQQMVAPRRPWCSSIAKH